MSGRPPLPPFGAWVGQLWGRPAGAARQVAREIEAAGYGALWIGEAYGREVLTMAGILLAATERIVVATGIANLWGRDAMTMANAGRTLAEAWPNRFVLGVGVSHRPLVDRRGHDYNDPVARTQAYLEAMRQAPYRAPAPELDPLVVVGALGDRMLRVTAAHADGAHPYLVTPAHTAHAREVLGRDRVLAPEQAFVLSEEPATARATARAHLATYLGLDNYVRSLRRQGFADVDLTDGGSDHLVDALVAWGRTDRIVARMCAHRDAGADHVAAHPLEGDGVPDPVEQLRTLAGALPS